MNISDLTSQLNNSASHKPLLTKELLSQAEKNNLVIVFGASDDLMEFRGAIEDEVDAYDGGSAWVDSKGLLPERDQIEDDELLKEFFARQPNAKEIKAIWCGDSGWTWSFETDIPHETFELVDGDENYCRGIVFSLNDAPA